MKRRLALGLISLLTVGLMGSSVATATVGTELILGNPSCDGLKIEPVEAGTYNLPNGGTITITLGAGNTFSFTTSGAVVSSILVKGGPNALLWTFDPPVTSYSGLHAPLNPANGKWYGLSHLCIDAAKKAPPPK